MVTQYPHTIEFIKISEGARDSEGDWKPGKTKAKTKPCRAEPATGNTGNSYISAANGERINYNWLVYLPLPVDTIKPGVKVRVKNGSEVLLHDTIKRFSRGQLNARIWL